MKASIGFRLGVMMFIQFFVWSTWFNTVNAALAAQGLDAFIGGAYGSAPLAAIIAPLFLGLVIDRFFSSERVMGVLFILGGVFMFMAHHFANAKNGDALVWMFIGHMLCFMPTLGLSNTIAFANIPDQNQFPRIRVWGTIGWIVAGLFIGFMGWSASLNMFLAAAVSSLGMGLYSFTLPHTPPPARGKPVDLRALLMVDAFSLLTRPPFLVFIVCSTLVCIPLGYYYGVTGLYLGNVGFFAPASTMTIGQMSEIFFMVLIPVFFRRLGVKNMLLIGMLAWAARYALFALGAPDHVVWMIYLAIAFHGVCYDFFFVTGFMYTDKIASADIRGQAQSMLVFFTQGVGLYFGYWVAFDRLGKTVKSMDELNKAIAASRPPTNPTFAKSLANMFSVEKPAVPAQLWADTMAQWKDYWLVPAAMAAAIAAIFFLLFWDKMSNYDKAKPGDGV
jgi:nucleoside transporter